jgi:Pregnancy-associated plasma protein-A/Secretion system C-terminal sorting domain/Fibronectin type III domain
MKKLFTLGLIALGSLVTNAQHRGCGAYEHLQHMEQDATVKANRTAIETFTKNYVAAHPNGTRAVITIPVVVHVVYNTATQNISDAQIASQLAVLNADFSKANADWTSTPSVFQSLVANAEIQFCMAQRTPTGAATTGIIRKSTTTASFSTNDAIKKTASGGDDAWPAASYLNLWVGNISGGILGYAQFPGGPAITDGVVINYTAFGNMGTAAAPYNKGRTATHEVGHWLNLNHIWGDDGTACTGTDNVGDTPNQGGENYGTPTFPKVSCSNGPNGDMFMNYMDYTDDVAMFMFSTGQKSRMKALFAAGGARVGLTTSLGCQAPSTTSTCLSPTALSSSSITQTTATLTWTAASGALGYTVKYGPTGGTQTTATVTGTSLAVTGLTAGSAYSWSVSTTCTGTTSASAAATFTTTAIAAGCSNNYESNNTTATATALAVNTNINSQIATNGDVDYYKFSNTTAAKNIKVELTGLTADYDLKLYKGTTLVGTSALSGTASETIKYNNGTVTTYYAQVFGYNGAFSSTSCYTLRASTSATAYRTNGNTTADVEENINLEKIQGNLDITVYPNPSEGNITIDILSVGAQENAAITILDMMGKQVYNASFDLENGINTKNVQLNVANGMYQIMVRANNETRFQKIAVQH